MAGVATAVGLGAAAIGAGATAYAANKAAGAQQSAAQRAQDTQMSMYNQTAGYLSPYRTAGAGALSQLQGLYGLPGGTGPTFANLSQNLSQMPGYNWQMQQGIQAIDRSQAAKGLLNSGATGKALMNYGQGLAQSTYINPYLMGLGNLAQMGQNAAAGTGTAAMQTGAGVAANQIAAGNAQASGYAGVGNAISGLASQGIGLYGLYSGGYFGNPGGYNPPGINAAAMNYNQTGLAPAGGGYYLNVPQV